MKKSIEDRLLESVKLDRERELRRLFELYRAAPDDLLNVLGSAQKLHSSDQNGWFDYVIDVMAGMDLHDAGHFPAEWFPADRP